MANNYIHRTIENKLEEMYNNFPAILITGAKYWISSTSNSDIWRISSGSNTPWPFDTSLNAKGGIRPVVSLKSNLKTNGMDLEGYWRLEI